MAEDSEPTGLNMSLEDMIKKSSSSSDKRGKGQHQTFKAKGSGGGYARNANSGPYQNKQHQNQFGSNRQQQGDRKIKEDEQATLDTRFETDSSGEEVFSAYIDMELVVRINSSGSITIGDQVERTRATHKAYNLCLRPFNFKIVFDADVKAGAWKLTRIEGGKFEQAIDKEITLSGFAKRDWPKMKEQLSNLPRNVNFIKNTDKPNQVPSNGMTGHPRGPPGAHNKGNMGGMNMNMNMNNMMPGGMQMMPMMMPMMMMSMMQQMQMQQGQQGQQGSQGQGRQGGPSGSHQQFRGNNNNNNNNNNNRGPPRGKGNIMSRISK